MMRVLHVIGRPERGGSETLAMNLYRKMNRAEIQFDFTSHTPDQSAYDNEIEALGGHILHLPKLKSYNYFQYKKAWRRLLKEHPEYQIIHIHNYNIAGIVASVAKKQGVRTIITHSHSTRLNVGTLKRIIFTSLHNSLISNSTHLFACGRKAGNFLFGKNADFQIIPNGIDVSQFKYNPALRAKIRQQLGIDESVKVYGHVGSFRTPKNHEFLTDVFAEIVKKEPDSRLILVGEGPLQDSIKEKVHKLDLDGQVIFAGRQDNVNEWLSAFDLFLLPSLWEGFPVSVVEAQCAGLPCVISDIIDRDSDITGKVKFIPLASDAATWAQEIISTSATDREEMGRIVAASDYNIDTVAAKLARFYKTV